jgi:hypothetical protein
VRKGVDCERRVAGRRRAMRKVALAVVLGAAPGAMAQAEGQATWLWDVTTQDGDAIVEPGETATVTLSVDMDPDVGDIIGDKTVLGFGAAIFDVLGGDGADKGEIIGWEIQNHLDFIAGDTTTTDGTSLFGSTVLQAWGINGIIRDDPIDVISFEWSPSVFSVYDVMYSTATHDIPPGQDGEVGIYLSTDDWSVSLAFWRIDEANVRFAVVPAPQTGVILMSGVLFGGGWARRRRSPLELLA